MCCTCKVAFMLIRPIVVVFSPFSLPLSVKVMLQHSLATLLRHCFEWLQHCSSIATLCCTKNRLCESSRVTLPLALHDFIFCSNKLLNIISRASLLALAKSIYYFSVAAVQDIYDLMRLSRTAQRRWIVFHLLQLKWSIKNHIFQGVVKWKIGFTSCTLDSL